jgi:hypothetical protein
MCGGSQRPRDQTGKSISRYFGSGQHSSLTVSSSESQQFRTFAIASAPAVVSAVRAQGRKSGREPLQLLASTATSTVRQQGAPVAPSATDSAASMHAAGAATKAAPPAKAAPGFTLKVPEGRTGLRDSMYVERSADSVVVHFDTELARTRRRDKFETTVRVTLPVLYGALADSMLAALPEGAITGGLDLVSEVAVRGVRLAIPTGGTLELWPVTRPGRDGPLVVGYRARVTP